MKNKKQPMRRCIGCMESKDKSQLIRIAWYEGKLTVDPTGRAKGRGVYLCKSGSCLEKARKRKAIQRSLQADIPEEELDRVFEELKDYEQ
ncbi:MAG: RNase P modulator RnpM [Lentihominibacter sp.]